MIHRNKIDKDLRRYEGQIYNEESNESSLDDELDDIDIRIDEDFNIKETLYGQLESEGIFLPKFNSNAITIDSLNQHYNKNFYVLNYEQIDPFVTQNESLLFSKEYTFNIIQDLMFTVHKRILPYFHVPNKHYLLIASKFIDPQNQFNLRYPVREHTEQGLVFLHGNKKKVHSFKTKRDKLKQDLVRIGDDIKKLVRAYGTQKIELEDSVKFSQSVLKKAQEQYNSVDKSELTPKQEQLYRFYLSKLKKTLTSEDPQFEVLRQFASNDEIIIYSMGKRIRDEKLEWLGIKDRFEGSYLETSDSINFDQIYKTSGIVGLMEIHKKMKNIKLDTVKANQLVQIQVMVENQVNDDKKKFRVCLEKKLQELAANTDHFIQKKIDTAVLKDFINDFLKRLATCSSSLQIYELGLLYIQRMQPWQKYFTQNPGDGKVLVENIIGKYREGYNEIVLEKEFRVGMGEGSKNSAQQQVIYAKQKTRKIGIKDVLPPVRKQKFEFKIDSDSQSDIQIKKEESIFTKVGNFFSGNKKDLGGVDFLNSFQREDSTKGPQNKYETVYIEEESDESDDDNMSQFEEFNTYEQGQQGEIEEKGNKKKVNKKKKTKHGIRKLIKTESIPLE